MKKNFVCFMVLIAFTAAVFLGCSGSGKKRVTQQNMENLNLTGLPIVKEKESFSLLIGDYGDPNKSLLPVFEEQTNVHVEAMAYPFNAAVERKNVLIASGDYPDTIAGWIMTADEIVRLAADGVAIPLGDLIDEYTVNIKEVLDKPGVREAMTHPDGNIYTIPYLLQEPLVTFHPWINSQWLKQLNLPMPTTTEEFKQTLIAFRDKIPPINGQPIIPFSWRPRQTAIGILAGWFGLDCANFFTMIDGQLEITVNRPEYKEFLKYFSDLYMNKLIDQELFTQDVQTWTAKGKQGLYGATYAYFPDDFAPRISDDTTINQWAYEPLPVLRAPGVEKPVFRRSSNGFTLFRSQFVITDNASNPITILRWVDFLYDTEKSFEAVYGPIGVRFEKLTDGNFREIDTSNWTDAEKQENSNPFFSALPRYFRPEIKMLPPEGRKQDYNIKEISDALYEPYLNELTPTFWLDRKTSQKMAAINEPISYYHSQKVAAWVSGQADIDAEWDTYVAHLERLGIQELLEINRDLIKR